MTIIEITANDNGGHSNQTSDGFKRPPEGYAEIPKGIGTPDTLENYPFGDITVDYSGEWPVVTSWTPLPIPEFPEPEPDLTVWDELDAAHREGVDNV